MALQANLVSSPQQATGNPTRNPIEETTERELELEKEIAQGARQRVQLFDEVGKRQDAYTQAVQHELALLTLTKEQIRQKELALQPLEPHQRTIVEGLLKEIAAAERVKEILEETERIRERSVDLRESLLESGRRQTLRIERDAYKIEQGLLKDRERDIQGFADFFSETILSVTDIGKRGFREFVDSAIADLQRLLVQRFLGPKLSDLLQTGLKLALGVARGVSVPDIAPAAITTVPTTTAPTFDFSSFAQPRQRGGPVMPGRFYTVGESGRELFVPREPGTIYPNGQGPPGVGQQPVNVTVIVNATDAGSFLRSQGDVRQAIARAVRNAQRDL